MLTNGVRSFFRNVFLQRFWYKIKERESFSCYMDQIRLKQRRKCSRCFCCCCSLTIESKYCLEPIREFPYLCISFYLHIEYNISDFLCFWLAVIFCCSKFQFWHSQFWQSDSNQTVCYHDSSPQMIQYYHVSTHIAK